MSGRSRGVMKFIDSFVTFLSNKRLTNKPKLIGKDHNGNRYYELHKEDSYGKKIVRRWYETEIPDDWEKEVPVEWEAWLRRRRSHPPTPQEIDENYRKMMSVKSKAADLLETQILGIKEPVSTEGKKEEISSEFPRHEEYELFPGEKVFPQDKKTK